MITVRDIYNYCRDNNIKMLSDYSADFWNYYRTNSARFDRAFSRRFGSFAPVHNGESVSNIANDFIEDFYFFLLDNHKRFDELYRIEVVTNEDDPLTYNYDLTETKNGTTGHNSTTNTGSQTSDTVYGAQSGNTTGEVSPEDSENFFNRDKTTQNVNSHTDTVTAGSRSDSHTGSDTENYTLTRKGNIGVQTASDMLRLHKDFWTGWTFFDYILNMFAKEYLILVDGECDGFDYYATERDDIFKELKNIESKIDNISVEVDFTPVINKIDSAKVEVLNEIGSAVDSINDNVDFNASEIISTIDEVSTNEY